MIDLASLEPIGRKQWVKRKWDEYTNSKVHKVIELSNKMYSEPTDLIFENNVNRSKWKATVDKKVNYLLARSPICAKAQDKLDAISSLLRETATKYYTDGSVIWIVQGDGEAIEPVPMIMEDSIAIYADKHKEKLVAIIRKRVDIELEKLTGAETEVEYYELYYGNKKEVYCFAKDDKDTEQVLETAPMFLEVGKTGDAPLFAYLVGYIFAFDHLMRHQDKATEANTDPLTEVRGYSGTSDEDLKYAIETLHIARTDGNGGVTIHTRAMDSNAMDLWGKRILQEFNEAACIVGKDNELQVAQSGKAMDRLFIDMENDARRLASLMEEALKSYFLAIGVGIVDIVWNTDRPTDDAAIISAIQASRGLVSDRTLLEQHPWVDDVEEEVRRIEEQNVSGMNDLAYGEDEGM